MWRKGGLEGALVHSEKSSIYYNCFFPIFVPLVMDICQRITSLLPGGNPDWMQQIETCYNESTRYYHTLDHVCCMFKQMDRVLDKLEDTEAVSWAIVFHE